VDRDAILEKISIEEWYHKIEIAPGIFTPGRYNPRPLLDIMGFPKDLSGKTVLDIGANDGFFTFEAEKRGAKRIVAVDRCPPDHLGFAMAHSLLNSKAEYEAASVYDLNPEKHGTFDVVLFFGVLYHLRHPLLALEKIHRVCKELLLIESQVLDEALVCNSEYRALRDIDPILQDSPLMQFYPGNQLHGDYSNWWSPNIECMRSMVETSGFQAELIAHWGDDSAPRDRAAFRATRLDFTPPHWY